MRKNVDTLIHAAWVIPAEPVGQVLTDHCVVIHDGRIVALCPSADAERQYVGASTRLPTHVLIPGFVNTHTHAAMTLFRGLADDLPLMQWLNKHIWPAENRWVDARFVELGTRLACAEMIKSGTTCFNDMYFFPDRVAAVAEEVGLRASVGLIMIDFPTAWAQTAEEYLRKGTELYDALRGAELITAAFAPHAPYTVSDRPLRKIQMLADELDIPVHMHVHETDLEISESLQRYHVRPLERLSGLGLLTDRLLAVHMTHLLPAEIEAVAASSASVVHCPQSNLKLASGLCRVAELMSAGVNVALGTDGAASNNDLDMLGEMQTAALLAKGVSGDPTALAAGDALAMATCNGAKALGIDASCGSIAAGKCADLVAVDLDHVATQPVFDPLTQLVYSAGREQVSDVWVQGRQLLQDHQLLTIEETSLIESARSLAAQIAEHDAKMSTEP